MLEHHPHRLFLYFRAIPRSSVHDSIFSWNSEGKARLSLFPSGLRDAWIVAALKRRSFWESRGGSLSLRLLTGRARIPLTRVTSLPCLIT